MGFFTKAKKTIQKVIWNASPHRLTVNEERAYWAEANSLSADGYITPEMRKTWRNRARMEAYCNSYAKGLVLTLADVCIGTGARLQLLTENDNYNSEVEQYFATWAEAINLGDKLKTLRKAKCIDGEAFAIIVNNPKVNHEIKIDLKIIESDRIATPYPKITERDVDGIHYDKYGNPVSYDVLKEHPGSVSFSKFNEVEKVPAEFMLHWYRQDRPEQSRGLTELLPSLPLFAQLRRYTLAVIQAAETAANIAGIVYTKTPDQVFPIDTEKTKTLELERNTMNVIPEGWEFSQLKAEQPTTTYSMFKREILSEIGRCLQMPTNIILGDSSNYNYASGRLDHQTFYKNIRNEQNQCEKVVLFPLLDAWNAEGVRIGLFRNHGNAPISSRYARFYWDGMEHVDPTKETEASAKRIEMRLTNHSIECARLGYDWEDVFEQLAREEKKAKELGLTLPIQIKQKKKQEPNEDED
jgi:lambda family phage portal protein